MPRAMKITRIVEIQVPIAYDPANPFLSGATPEAPTTS